MASPDKQGLSINIPPEMLMMLLHQGASGPGGAEQPMFGRSAPAEGSSGSGKSGRDFAPSGGSGVGSLGAEQSRGSTNETVGGSSSPATPRRTLLGN